MTKHLITGEELAASDLHNLLDLAGKLKHMKKKGQFPKILKNKHLAMLFDKPSLRTRFSFMIAMQELGGSVVESISDTRKTEEPQDVARVLSGYCNGIMIRTHHEEKLFRLKEASSIPIINALSDHYHPCQILADLLTIKEVCGSCEGRKLAYIGDGNNILHSLLLMAPLVGVHLHYCCPKSRQPKEEILAAAKLKSGWIEGHSTPQSAIKDAHAVYTDVWTSMGFESSTNEALFDGFQVNEQIMAHALPQAIFMHCMPMERGKEVSHTLPDSSCSVIFEQSENRLHVQKALLMHVIR